MSPRNEISGGQQSLHHGSTFVSFMHQYLVSLNPIMFIYLSDLSNYRKVTDRFYQMAKYICIKDKMAKQKTKNGANTDLNTIAVKRKTCGTKYYFACRAGMECDV